MGNMDQVDGQFFYQLFFGSQWGFGVMGKSDSLRHPENMGINGHIRLGIDNRSDDIGGFAANARQLDQFFQ